MSAPRKPATGTRAVYYLRVSTAGQVEDGTSLETQKAWCLAEIDRRGWEPVGEFIERGESGANATRPEWTRLLSAARDRQFDAVFVFDLDRFTRDILLGIGATRDLRALGIALHDAKNPATNAAAEDEEFLTGLRMLWAQEERRKIRERTVRGQRARGHQGHWPGGTPPYGWRLEGHKPARPVRDEAEHETFMLMVDLLVKRRWNCGKIADHLNALGTLTRSTIRDRKRAQRLGEPEPTGTPWSREVVRMILGNEVHWTGKVTFGAPNQSGKYARSHKTKLDWEGKPVYGEPIELTLPEPPLSKAQYQAVRRALARREQSNPAAARSQMLTLRVFGACGMPYYGVSLKDKPFDTYRCTGNRHGRDKCGCKQVQVQDLDERVWSVVSGFLSDPARLEAAARAWLELPDEADEGGAEVVAGIDKRIRELERGQANAARELLLSETPDLLRAALAEIGRELATLKERRAGYEAFRAQATAKAQQISDLAALAERARGRLATMPPEARREICEILGIRVQMDGGIVSGKDRVARPERLVVTGSIDPRLSFGEGGGAADGGSGGGSGPDNSGSDGRTPGGSSGAHLVDRTAPSNSAKSGDGGDGVLGGRCAGVVSEESPGAAPVQGGQGVVHLRSSFFVGDHGRVRSARAWRRAR